MKASQPASIGRYQVRDRIGRGGMGVVYLAVDPLIERLLAVKLLRVDSDEMHDRFVREAKLAGRLQHPNIVTIFDVGEHEGQPFIAMEYVAGETLAEKIRRRIPLPVERKVSLIADLCDGLAYAHRAGIVHRDIKPSNVILSREGVLKILDFGIARSADSGLTQTGMMVGTPSYMSPEQVDGRAIDHRSDIFSTGLLLYEVLAFRQAYPEDTPLRIAQRILTAEPDPLDQLCPDLDPALVQIVGRALQKDPDARYADISAMRLELLRVRYRLEAVAREATVIQTIGATPSTAPEQQTLGSSTSDIRDERQAQIASHVGAALKALQDGRHETAIAAAERAVMLDPSNAQAHEIIEQARVAVDERQLQVCVREAREAIGRGALTDAFRLTAQALKLNPRSSDALSLRRELETLERDREGVQERSRAIEAALTDARSLIQQGAYESAARAAAEVLVHDPSHTEARAIRQQAAAAIERVPNAGDRPRQVKPSGRPYRLWAAAGLTVSATAAVLFISGFWATPPRQNEPAPSRTGGITTGMAPATVAEAREQWSRKDRYGAVATIQAALVSAPNDPDLRRLLREIVDDARAAVARTEADARQVRAEALAATRFQDAILKLKQFEPLANAKDPTAAVVLWEAEALFSAAATEARNASAIEAADAKLAAVVRQARDLWTRRRNPKGALALLADQIAIQPDSVALQALVREFASDAARSMERARGEALSVRAPELRQSDFARAEGKMSDATQLQLDGRNDRAVLAFLEAESLFVTAGRAAASTPEPRSPSLASARPNTTEAAEGSSGIEKSTGATTSAALPSVPPAAPPAAPVRFDSAPAASPPNAVAALDASRIDRLLDRYVNAYRRLDFDALKQIFPAAGADRKRGIDQSKRACKAYDVTIASRQISTSTNGNVMLTVEAVHTCTPRTAQKELVSPMDEIFMLQRDSTDNWVINKTGMMDR